MVVAVDVGRVAYWVRLGCGPAMSWKKLTPGDWIVTGAGGVVEWWSDRRMKGEEWGA